MWCFTLKLLLYPLNGISDPRSQRPTMIVSHHRSPESPNREPSITQISVRQTKLLASLLHDQTVRVARHEATIWGMLCQPPFTEPPSTQRCRSLVVALPFAANSHHYCSSDLQPAEPLDLQTTTASLISGMGIHFQWDWVLAWNLKWVSQIQGRRPWSSGDWVSQIQGRKASGHGVEEPRNWSSWRV